MKNVPFDLTAGDVRIPSHCPALGIPMHRNANRAGDDSPTLDRVVPHLGYVAGNVVVISGLANRIKSSATWQQVLAVGIWLKGVTDQNPCD